MPNIAFLVATFALAAAVGSTAFAQSPTGLRQLFVALHGKVVSVDFVGGAKLDYDHGVDCAGVKFVTLLPFGENNLDRNPVYVQLTAVRAVRRMQPTADQRVTETAEARSHAASTTCPVDSLAAALKAEQGPYRIGLTTGRVLTIGATKKFQQNAGNVVITYTASNGATRTATLPATSVAFIQGELPAK